MLLAAKQQTESPSALHATPACACSLPYYRMRQCGISTVESYCPTRCTSFQAGNCGCLASVCSGPAALGQSEPRLTCQQGCAHSVTAALGHSESAVMVVVAKLLAGDAAQLPKLLTFHARSKVCKSH